MESAPEVDLEALASHPFDMDVVFIAVDVESFERSHSQITEIGISTIDTRDLQNLSPGLEGKNWMARVRARHFRIKDNAHLVNSDFIAGCPDRFEKEFGTSEFIALKDAPGVVASCFQPPFSAKVEADGSVDALKAPALDQPPRNVVLVGHNARSDIDYLRDLGYNVAKLPNLIEVLDTSELHRALKHETQAASLGSVLMDVGVDGWNLHNAVRSSLLSHFFSVSLANSSTTTSGQRRSLHHPSPPRHRRQSHPPQSHPPAHLPRGLHPGGPAQPRRPPDARVQRVGQHLRGRGRRWGARGVPESGEG